MAILASNLKSVMVAAASSIPTRDNFFSKFIFPEGDLLSDFLSDLLIAKNRTAKII